MAKQGVGKTALGAAVCRLIEQSQPEETRLFHDPVVKDLVGTPIRVLMQFESLRTFTRKQTDAITPGIYGAQICRTRFIDDAVQAALSQGIGQVVILGAGLDTRPYRLAGMERVNVLEVDLPSVQEDKKKKLHKHFGRLPEQVTFLPIDFETQSLEAVFTGTAFDPCRPVVFVWEGVTQYLSEEAVRRTLTCVGTIGSWKHPRVHLCLEKHYRAAFGYCGCGETDGCGGETACPLAFRPGTLLCSIFLEAISSETDSRRWECRVSSKLSQASGTEPGGVRR